jgi:E3 ubiquitin-protein ligase NRDP1
LKQDEIQKALTALKQKNPNLSSDDACSQQLDPKDFECPICLQIVFAPEQCQECEKLFCQACINQWNSEKCPACKQEFVKMTKIPRMTTQTLQKLAFKCQECSEVFDYATSIEHKMKHHPQDCPFGCGAGLADIAEIRQHLQGPECPNVPVHCEDCDTDTFLNENHRCADKLNRKIQDLSKQLESSGLKLEEKQKECDHERNLRQQAENKLRQRDATIRQLNQ